MKKIVISFLSIGLFLFIGFNNVITEPYPNVDITITSMFDDDNLDITNHLTNQVYGSKLSLDSQLADEENYSFAFWIVNGAVRKDLSINHEFILTADLSIMAVFSPVDKHAVLFMDSNLLLLDVQYITDGGTANDITEGLPSKPGYIISTTNKWSASLTNITEDQVLVLQYERVDNTEYTLSVTNGVGSGTFTYNDLVTVQAAPTLNGEYFNYWVINDKIVSYETEYTFTIFNHTTVEAIYLDQPIYNLPLVTVSNDLEVRTGYKSFLGQFHVPNGYELIEYGMITSLMDEAITLSSDGISKYQGFNHVFDSGEWLMSFNEVNHTYVRAYLIVKNTQDELITFYSDIETVFEPVEYIETFDNLNLTGSSYVSGSFTGNYDILWTYENVRGDFTLDGKAIMFANQASHADGPSTLSATIDGGINSFYAELEQAFTGSGERTLGLFINDILIDEFTYNQTTKGIQIWTVDNINVTDTFKLEIRHTAPGSSRGQVVLDNLTWTTFESVTSSSKYLLQLESNKDVSIVVSESGPWYEENTNITLTAPEIEDYVFMHWLNMVTGQFESMLRVYTFDISNHTYLRAVYAEDSEDYTLLLDSNIPGDHTYKSHSGPYSYNELVSIEADSVTGYDFLYWHNMKTDHVYSYEQALNINMLDSYHLRAIYQESASLLYTTDFNDATKSSYTLGTVTLNSRNWSFDNAVLNSVDGGVARFRQGGTIQTEFKVENMTRIIFEHKRTQTTSRGSLWLQVSLDGLEWITLTDSIESELDVYNVTMFDIDLFMLWEVYGIKETDGLYVRLFNTYFNSPTSNLNANIEIKNLGIYTYDDFVGFPLYNYESNVLSFNFSEAFTKVYGLGDAWSPVGCVANDIILGTVSCDVSGSVDTSERGSYIVTYSAIDSNGTLTEYRVQKDVIRDTSLLDITLSSYYESIEGLYGHELKLALRLLLMDMTFISYGDVRFALEDTDLLDDESDYIQLYYYDGIVPAVWDEGNTWNREHVWPASRLPVQRPGNSTRDMSSDLHNLVPEDPAENTFRSNHPFDYNPLGTASPYEVRDPFKGNVARIIFYMYVRYDMLSLVEENPSIEDFEMGILSTLIEWHYFDDVDAFESRRNNVIYNDYQGNRNPFIDYPHLVELLFFNHPSIPMS